MSDFIHIKLGITSKLNKTVKLKIKCITLKGNSGEVELQNDQGSYASYSLTVGSILYIWVIFKIYRFVSDDDFSLLSGVMNHDRPQKIV